MERQRMKNFYIFVANVNEYGIWILDTMRALCIVERGDNATYIHYIVAATHRLSCTTISMCITRDCCCSRRCTILFRFSVLFAKYNTNNGESCFTSIENRGKGGRSKYVWILAHTACTHIHTLTATIVDVSA